MSPRSPSPASSDGEVLSGDEEKAISTHAHRDRNSKVNSSTRHLQNGSSSRASRPDPLWGLMNDKNYHFRNSGEEEIPRKRSRSPYRRPRSRSPYRAPKVAGGEKRGHDDDHYAVKGTSEPRRFKVHYEDKARSGKATGSVSQRPHAHLDRSELPAAQSQYNDRLDRGRGRSGRDRDRSRSPFRHRALTDGTFTSDGGAQHILGPTQDSVELRPKLSEADVIEQRRKKREAIKAKHRSQPGLLVQALEQSLPSAPATPIHDSNGAPPEQQSPPSSVTSPRTPNRDSPPASPAAFIVADDEELANRHQADDTSNDEEGPSAADYDPNMDMQEDRPDHKKQDLQDPAINGGLSVETLEEPHADLEPRKEFDMFADDDDDDMFAPTDSAAKPAMITKQARTLDQSLLDNWDYPDGHYRVILGELLDDRYAVQQQIGKGTFATVVRAQDTRTGNYVAVKIACNNETMYKAGTKEMDFLNLLNQNDPDDKRHIIRLLRNFDHKGHLCLVFEALSADLREVLKKFGRNIGLNLKAIRSYAQQMFMALSHMKKCQILHADLKPDNILVSEKRSLLKLCDLGTAAFADDAEITPYLVSRFYRAPEVILGMPFDYAIDMWSIGCTLFELYTGRILFPGADNNQMLRVIQECRGKFPIRMLKRSTLADRHFDLDGTFFSQDRDKLTGKATLRPVNFNKAGAGKDLRSRLNANAKGMTPPEMQEHAAFVDLMDKCLQLDPARRISPNDALRHNFVAHSPAIAEKPVGKVVPAMGQARWK